MQAEQRNAKLWGQKHQDAGATSVYLIFQAMREFVEGLLDNDCVGEQEWK